MTDIFRQSKKEENIMGWFRLSYLIPGLIVCGILFVVFYFWAKKENAQTEDLLKMVSDEDKETLKTKDYVPSGKLHETEGLVASVTEKGDKTLVNILFYNAPRDEIYNQPTKVATKDVAAKGIKQGAFIPCIMKFDKDFQVYSLKSVK